MPTVSVHSPCSAGVALHSWVFTAHRRQCGFPSSHLHGGFLRKAACQLFSGPR